MLFKLVQVLICIPVKEDDMFISQELASERD